MKTHSINARQLNAIEKSVKSIVGDDPAKQEQLEKSFEQLRTNLEDVTIVKDVFGDAALPKQGDDPVRDIFLGMYEAVEKVLGAEGTAIEKSAMAQEIFEKGFGALDGLTDEVAKAAYAVGVEK